MTQLQQTIEAAFERRDSITPAPSMPPPRPPFWKPSTCWTRQSPGCREDCRRVGRPPVAEEGRAALLPHQRQRHHRGDDAQYYDKVPLKFSNYTEEQFKAAGVRVVPPATARKGSFIAPNTVLMPSYVNIGAFVDEGTMVDTWATVGSCAQIGKNVHLSGGVGIGGVLEPLQANPTIIEDNCFIGARSEVVEGVIVEGGLRHLHGGLHRPVHPHL